MREVRLRVNGLLALELWFLLALGITLDIMVHHCLRVKKRYNFGFRIL